MAGLVPVPAGRATSTLCCAVRPGFCRQPGGRASASRRAGRDATDSRPTGEIGRRHDIHVVGLAPLSGTTPKQRDYAEAAATHTVATDRRHYGFRGAVWWRACPTTPSDWPNTADLEQFAEIVNYYIETTTINFHDRPQSAEDWEATWEVLKESYPFVVAETDGVLGGIAYASPWKLRGAYDWTCEVTVYVRAGHERQGLGKALSKRMLEILEAQGYRAIVAVIALPNEASVALHEALGLPTHGHPRKPRLQAGRVARRQLLGAAAGRSGHTPDRHQAGQRGRLDRHGPGPPARVDPGRLHAGATRQSVFADLVAVIDVHRTGVVDVEVLAVVAERVVAQDCRGLAADGDRTTLDVLDGVAEHLRRAAGEGDACAAAGDGVALHEDVALCALPGGHDDRHAVVDEGVAANGGPAGVHEPHCRASVDDAVALDERRGSLTDIDGYGDVVVDERRGRALPDEHAVAAA